VLNPSSDTSLCPWCVCDAVKNLHTNGNLICAGTERTAAACVSMRTALQQGNITVLTTGHEEAVYTAVQHPTGKFKMLKYWPIFIEKICSEGVERWCTKKQYLFRF